MFSREKQVSVKFMVIVTDPRNESTRESTKVSHDITGTTLLTYLARAPLQLVPRPGWAEHLASRLIKPLVLPTREDTVDCRSRRERENQGH